MERYISICKPFLRYRFDIKSWYYIVTVVTFSVIYNTPRFFEWMTISEPIERPCLSSLYQQGNLVSHHISYRSNCIPSAIISHTFYNQPIYLIPNHKLRVQYLILLCQFRKSRFISHTIHIGSVSRMV